MKVFGPTAATIGSGFFVGVLIGYALKKVIKIAAVIVGLFLSALAYLQYHHIANINWNKLQTVSEGAVTTLSNAISLEREIILIFNNNGMKYTSLGGF